MKNLIDFGNPFAIVGALFLLVVAVLAVWGLVRSRAAKRPPPLEEPVPTAEEAEYLDSSHIISSPLIGRDPRARGAPPAKDATDAKRR